MSNTEALAEALEWIERAAKDMRSVEYVDRYMTVIRAALAQPAASGEPVAWIEGPHGAIRMNMLWKLDPMPPQSIAWSIPLYTMSPKATSGTCTAQPAPARVPRTLTEEQLERHGYQASECPPNSQVMLVSSIRRLLGYAGTPAKEAP